MASVIIAGTPAIVVGVGGGADGITSVVGGLYTSVDPTIPSAPVVNSTLVAGDGILISGGNLNGVSVNLAAGAGITVTPPVSPGDPITIAATGGGGNTATGIAIVPTTATSVTVANTNVTATSVILASFCGTVDTVADYVKGITIVPGANFTIIVNAQVQGVGQQIAWFISQF